MTKQQLFDTMRGTVIVSCQAVPGEPLYDPQRSVMYLMARAAKQAGAKMIRTSSARDIREMGRREASEYMVDTFCLPCTPKQVMEGVNALVTGEYRDRVPMKTGADTLLERLGALGVPCGIATASEAFQARDAMVRLGLWKHFLFAFSSLQYGPKTGPDLYRAAARSLGSAPERTVVFEDALHAARSAKRAGFLVAGVYDPSAEEDQEALRCLCDWYLPRLDSPDFLAALERG